MSMTGTEKVQFDIRDRMASVIGKRGPSPLLPYANYGAQKIGRLGIIGIALCLFSIAATISANRPLHDQVAAQAVELENMRASAADGESPGRETNQQIDKREVVDELPARDELPRYLGEIVSIAATTGLSLDRGDYEFSDTQSSAISSYRLTLPVRGSYPQVRQFIEETLAAIPVVALESLRVERNTVSDQIIAADLEFAILVRNEP